MCTNVHFSPLILYKLPVCPSNLCARSIILTARGTINDLKVDTGPVGGARSLGSPKTDRATD